MTRRVSRQIRRSVVDQPSWFQPTRVARSDRRGEYKGESGAAEGAPDETGPDCERGGTDHRGREKHGDRVTSQIRPTGPSQARPCAPHLDHPPGVDRIGERG